MPKKIPPKSPLRWSEDGLTATGDDAVYRIQNTIYAWEAVRRATKGGEWGPMFSSTTLVKAQAQIERDHARGYWRPGGRNISPKL